MNFAGDPVFFPLTPVEYERRGDLIAAFKRTRGVSLDLVKPLAAEDFRSQSILEVSPPWWSLGHTTWFYSKNILDGSTLSAPEDSRLNYVLNSYYNVHGRRVCQKDRGRLCRPTTKEILEFRKSVDARMVRLIEESDRENWPQLCHLVWTGLQHEHQHQELFLTEIKNIYSFLPPELRPLYQERQDLSVRDQVSEWRTFPEVSVEIGTRSEEWSCDNEKPRHLSCVGAFELSSRYVTSEEYLEFIQDGGYRRPEFWLDNGFRWAEESRVGGPLYWEKLDNSFVEWTLSGFVDLEPSRPVSHVSFYEADAFCRWKGMTFQEFRGVRLPSEEEWERAATEFPLKGDVLENQVFHPRGHETLGNLWEWTSSAYRPYSGYRPHEGSLAEYNGKFMDGQYVLRGGSFATPRDHLRVGYRNYWEPRTRFQFSGFRLARSK